MKFTPLLLALLMLSGGLAQAIQRTSTDANHVYTITADTLDSGGGLSTSTDASHVYTNSGSLGLIVGISGYTDSPTSPTITETNKAGYVAQLYDATNTLKVYGLNGPDLPVSVVSQGTVQLSASQVLDDGSLLPLPAGSVMWAVTGGSLVSVSSSGLVTAAAVTSNQSGMVSATYGSATGTLSIAVIGQTQTITFPAIGTHAVGDGQFLLQATSTSGVTVTYTVLSNNATISGNLLTITGPGPVTVQAFAGGSNYVPAEQLQTFQVLDANARFQGLGDLAGGTTSSGAYGVGNGGLQAAGTVDDGAFEAALWSNDYQGLHVRSLGNGTAGVAASARALTADGAVLVGVGNSNGYQPFLYTVPRQANGTASPYYLGTLNGYASGSAQAVSAVLSDGSVAVAGFSSSAAVPGSGVTGDQAFVWTQSGGLRGLGALPGGSGSRADGISADGSVIVGTSSTDLGPREAFVYSTSNGLQGLGAFSGGGFISSALAISADGRTIVGNSATAAHQQACFWHPADTTPTALPETSGATESSAEAVCGDGTIAVGYQILGGNRQAAVWENGEAQTLQTLLAAAPYNLAAALSGWTLTEATSISPDGFAIAGLGMHNGNPEGWVVILPRLPTIRIVTPAPVAEGASSVTVTLTKSLGLPTDVSYQIADGTAVQVSDGVGDYDATGLSGLVHFDTPDTSKTIVIPLHLNPSQTAAGSRSFTVTLSSATNGAVLDPNASSASVVIDSSTTADPNAPPSTLVAPGALPALGSLQVYLQDPTKPADNSVPPSNAFGPRAAGSVPGWRLAGELAWRDSGATVPGLAAGDFVIEFESVVNFSATPPKFLPAPPPTVATVTAGPASVRSILYPLSATPVTGTLEVDLAPDPVAGNSFLQQRGQWRFLGESDSMWRNSGATIPGLPVGSYLIEFKPVPGYAVIPTHSAQVTTAGVALVQALYQQEEATAGALPQPLTFAQATSQAPYEFVGQLTTDIGSGSGVAVAQRVVLTAAHAIFDDAAATYATGLQWQFQRVRGQLEPEPLVPRGAYLLDGYAAARVGVAAGVGTPASQELDAAALYFDVPAGNNGSSGYLLSTPATPWLAKTRRKILAGYPVDTAHVTAANLGLMWATPAQPAAFTVSPQAAEVYSTQAISGLAGMSGGPVFAQYDDGAYYPAGIYLGGNQQCVARAIDADVQSLIQNAVLSGQDGANHVGGGQIQVHSENFGSTFHAASVTVDFGSHTPAQARWQIAGQPALQASGAKVTLTTGTPYTIVFSPAVVLGVGVKFSAPASYGPFLVAAGQALTIDADYGVLNAPVITTSALAPAALGVSYTAQIQALHGPTRYAATLTDPLGATVNAGLPALGLSLGSTGKLSGTVPAGVTPGTYRLSVIASNGAGPSGARPLDLTIAPSGTLSVTVTQSDQAVAVAPGTITLTDGTTHASISPIPTSVPQNELLSFTATPKSALYVFDSWKGSSGPGQSVQVLSRSATLSIGMPAQLALTANFIPNPYLAAAGAYTGLLRGDADTLGARGFLSLTLTSQGKFTVAVTLGAQHYSAAGVFDGQGGYVGVIKGARGQSDLALGLQIDPTNTAQTLTGTATLNGNSLAVSAHKAAFSAHATAPQALGQRVLARYTMALHHPATSTLPQGDGYGTVTVTPAGAVQFVGTLGDGTALSAGATLGKDGEWPFYILPIPYHSAGVVTGPLTIDPAGTIAGKLDWIKPADHALYYPGGFTITDNQGGAIAVTGRPLGAHPLASLTSGTFTLGGGGLNPSVGPFTVTITSAGVQTGVSTPAGLTSFRIVPSTGLYSGQFHDAAGKTRLFNGVLLPASGVTSAAGFGLFKGDTASQQTGSVEF